MAFGRGTVAAEVGEEEPKETREERSSSVSWKPDVSMKKKKIGIRTIFKRKKKVVPEDVKTDEFEDGNIAPEEEPEEEKKEIAVSGDKAVNKLLAGIELIKARIDTFEKVREADNERFTRINEEIGELRSMSIEREKQMKDIEVSATKASDLVEEVQPEKLMIEVKKQDVKIEAAEAKIEGNETLTNSIIDEIKELKNRLSVFRGVDGLVKLSEDVKNELASAKKVKAMIDQHSDKVENIFMEVQKNFMEFKEYSEIAKELKKSFESLLKELESVKAMLPKLADKKEVKKIEDNVAEKIGFIDELLEKIEKGVGEGKDNATATDLEVCNTKIEEMLDVLETLTKKFTDDNERLRSIESKVASLATLVGAIQERSEGCIKDEIGKKLKPLMDEANAALLKIEHGKMFAEAGTGKMIAQLKKPEPIPEPVKVKEVQAKKAEATVKQKTKQRTKQSKYIRDLELQYERMVSEISKARKKGKDTSIVEIRAMSIPPDIHMAKITNETSDISKVEERIAVILDELRGL